MAGSNVIDITQIRTGMEVQAADGVKLGKIAEVWVGTDPRDSTTRCDEDTCSRLEVRVRGGPMYIPYSALAGVSGKSVTLNVDAATAQAKPWQYRPPWIAAS